MGNRISEGWCVMLMAYKIISASDHAINVMFPNRVDPQINLIISRLTLALQNETTITALLPAFRTLTVFYQPLITDAKQIKDLTARMIEQLDLHQSEKANVVHIPVCYTAEFGPDLVRVAAHGQLSIAELIRRHTQPDYLIYMLGFLPGFAYLGGLDPQLAMPRLASPRAAIPAGSVGIAGEQTGMYPFTSPGGWQLIGRTPLRLFDPERERPLLYQAGDYIHFEAIDEATFARLADDPTVQVKVTQKQVND